MEINLKEHTRVANNADPDQNVKQQSHLGQHCFLWPLHPNIYANNGIII